MLKSDFSNKINGFESCKKIAAKCFSEWFHTVGNCSDKPFKQHNHCLADGVLACNLKQHSMAKDLLQNNTPNTDFPFWRRSCSNQILPVQEQSLQLACNMGWLLTTCWSSQPGHEALERDSVVCATSKKRQRTCAIAGVQLLCVCIQRQQTMPCGAIEHQNCAAFVESMQAMIKLALEQKPEADFCGKTCFPQLSDTMVKNFV